jgi:hypothetical protein
MSLESTKLAANKLFASEGVHDLSIEKSFDGKKWSLMSTSGTSYYLGYSLDECQARRDELMLFATTGY